MRERESLFNEYLLEVRKREKDEKAMRRDQVLMIATIHVLIIFRVYNNYHNHQTDKVMAVSQGICLDIDSLYFFN